MFPLVLLLLVCCGAGQVSTRECTTGFYAQKDYCSREVFHARSRGWNTKKICLNATNNYQFDSCSSNGTCGKNYQVTVFDQQLFAISMKNTFIHMLTGFNQFTFVCLGFFRACKRWTRADMAILKKRIEYICQQ